MYWCGVFKSPEIFTTILTKEPLAIVCMYDLPCILFLNKSNSIPFNYSNLIFFFLIFHRLTKTFYLTKPIGKLVILKIFKIVIFLITFIGFLKSMKSRVFN